MTSIRFDENCSLRSPYWNLNGMFLEKQVEHLKDIFYRQGYLYLNFIYEAVGAKWDPVGYENICYLRAHGELNFDIVPISGEPANYLIWIWQ